ncbi:MAG: serine/threonine protein kinase [Myxococcaceae bacterium]|nr:serine/threonine protein kinase [Myxococcaceae bacterium]
MGEPNTVTVADSGPSQGLERAPSLTHSLPTDASALPLPSPETVLHRAEVEQSRRTAIAGLAFNTLALVVLPWLGGDADAKHLCGLALAGAELNNLWLLFVSWDEKRYRESYLLVYFVAAPFLNAGVIYYLGVLGAVLVMLVLNIYTACLGYGRRVARVTLVGSIAPVAVLGTLIALGVVRDRGLIKLSPDVPTFARLIVVAALSAFLVAVYSQARAARALMVSSLRERDDAVRRASHREALFLEARQDLERALQNGGLGRFTDQTLGAWRLGAVIGRGAMGEVYEATHAESGAQAAVKLLLPEVLGHADAVRRFMREMKIAASLDSPHVVRVIEVGDESAPLPYLAMERLRGEDLAQVLRREGRLGPRVVVDIVRQLGKGLAAASKAGIVHRDLKPQNVFKNDPAKPGDPPVWKILDFGVATLEDHSGALTVNKVVGTPQYMAPEQARQGTVDARTDLHALGAIAYRALTGHPPFKGRDFGELIAAVMGAMPVRPSALVKLPADVDLALAIALAKSPDDRFGTGDQLADVLELALVNQLPDNVRDRAAALLSRQPWLNP